MAANCLGLGFDNVVKIKVDEEGRMDSSDLAVKVQETIDAGKSPFCVVGTSGSTVRGAYDPLTDLSAICKAHNMWFHVDAAWGGACLLSPTHKHLMAGAHLADSLCWDAHKMMGVPMICSAFITTNLPLLK
jgi:glutamate/tyrosine decarboxylase-like PLP-dependent enzyme